MLGEENTDKYFKFIYDNLENEKISAIERSGSAEAFAEIICCIGTKM
jgi:hypothetical protein